MLASIQKLYAISDDQVSFFSFSSSDFQNPVLRNSHLKRQGTTRQYFLSDPASSDCL